MKENVFQSKLKKKIEAIFPDAIVKKFNPEFSQGFPDLLILFSNGRFANLECKKSADAHHQPNQDYWVERLDRMSYARFIYPENEKEILDDLERTFKT